MKIIWFIYVEIVVNSNVNSGKGGGGRQILPFLTDTENIWFQCKMGGNGWETKGMINCLLRPNLIQDFRNN